MYVLIELTDLSLVRSRLSNWWGNWAPRVLGLMQRVTQKLDCVWLNALELRGNAASVLEMLPSGSIWIS